MTLSMRARDVRLSSAVDFVVFGPFDSCLITESTRQQTDNGTIS